MQKYIKIRGAKEHNLKNIDIDLPREKFIVMTGLSGSGKSSLAFDTIFAEGQRRYVESLSTYARMFLGQTNKPDVTSISGLSPTVSIDQKTNSHNPRSTVGTVTEIYDYLRLLYARVGKPHCPNCKQAITNMSVDGIIAEISKYGEGSRLLVMAPLVMNRKGEYKKLLETYHQKGYVRFMIDGEMYDLDDAEPDLQKNKKHSILLVVDRIVLRRHESARLSEALQLALQEGDGIVYVKTVGGTRSNGESETANADIAAEKEVYGKLFSQKNACPRCNISIGVIDRRLFSFNNPLGACSACNGLGSFKSVDVKRLIPDTSLSLNQGAIAAPGFNVNKSYGSMLISSLAKHYGIDLDCPFAELPEEQKQLIFYGNGNELIKVDLSKMRFKSGNNKRSFEGLIPMFHRRYQEALSNVEMLPYYEKLMQEQVCASCQGQRLNEQALAVYFAGKNIAELCDLPLNELATLLKNCGEQLSDNERLIADKLLVALNNRLDFMLEVGLDYLTLSRSAMTLSGGEAQRIRLATQIGSALTGVVYILDEPSIGLHQRDNDRLLKSLERLKTLGNTVIVVEHDEDTMLAADYLVDLGPGAGKNGGEIVAAGTPEEVMAVENSVTAAYLTGRKAIPYNSVKRKGNGKKIVLKGATRNNLQNIDVSFPLGKFIAVTGVSGSGKSSLVRSTLLPALQAALSKDNYLPDCLKAVSGTENIDKVISIDQSPIGRTPRSNPATYTGVFDLIRQLFAEMPLAQARGYKAGRFSFNVAGGRCETCKGDGVKKIEMNFLPDVYVACDVCQGRRYQADTLDVKVADKSIYDVLSMDIATAYDFFKDYPRIRKKLQTLMDVGLSYLTLGHNSTLLSGGEAQRIKLATELSRQATSKTFYILDEPTTGLHIADVHRLVDILQQLVDQGNTVLVIEHNLDVIKVADHIIDLGPEGGKGGGQVIATGTPAELMACEASYTGRYLKQFVNKVEKKR